MSVRTRFWGSRKWYEEQAKEYLRNKQTAFAEWNLYAQTNARWLGIGKSASRVERKAKQLLVDGDRDFYNLGGIKIPIIEQGFDIMWGELEDLLIPYLTFDQGSIDMYRTGAGYSVEGPYEHCAVCVADGDNVIDCGANLGIFSIFSGFKAAHVYAFEPMPQICELLQQTIIGNNMQEKIEIIQAACGNKNGTIGMEESINLGGSHISERDDVTTQVRITTIDQFVNTKKVKIDFIKADIEGAERDMLRGAQETLAAQKPKLAICTYHHAEDRELLTQIIQNANSTYNFYYTNHKLFAW